MYSQYPVNRYVSGTYKRECDTCGFDYLRSELKKQYNGLIVCPECFELKPRHERKKHIRKTIQIRIE